MGVLEGDGVPVGQTPRKADRQTKHLSLGVPPPWQPKSPQVILWASISFHLQLQEVIQFRALQGKRSLLSIDSHIMN